MATPRAAFDPGAVCLPDFSDYFLKIGMVDNGSGALQVIKRPDHTTCTNIYIVETSAYRSFLQWMCWP